ncbi:MFS transporter [Actinokineospora enzanensis]|uniref:MFS transporter n=1 Tax=Actinokineospora enzanensis TaxID=155975 RepID=UPI0003670651|nr:MFS transporter [Actinokineospora enzanensis]
MLTEKLTGAVRRSADSLRASSRSERILVFSCLADSLGSGLFLAIGAAFFTRMGSLEAAQYALGLSVAGLVGFVLTIPMGLLGDRFGARRTLICLNLWRAVGYSCYALAGTFTTFIIVVVFTAIADRTAGAIGQAVVADVADQDRRIGLLAVIRSVRNIGYASGGLVAGFAITANSRPVYYSAIAMVALFYVICAGMLTRVRSAPDAVGAVRTRREWAFKDRRYLAFTALNTVLSLHVTTLNVLLPLWILANPTIPPGFAATPLIVNTIIVSLLQFPATRRITTISAAGRAAFAAAVLLAAACVLFLAASWLSVATYAVIVVLGGALLLTVAEMWQAASSWQISMDLAPDHSRSQYLATFSLSTTAERVVGPAGLTVLVLTVRPWGWLLLGIVVLLAGLATLRLARRVPAEPLRVAS